MRLREIVRAYWHAAMTHPVLDPEPHRRPTDNEQFTAGLCPKCGLHVEDPQGCAALDVNWARMHPAAWEVGGRWHGRPAPHEDLDAYAARKYGGLR